MNGSVSEYSSATEMDIVEEMNVRRRGRECVNSEEEEHLGVVSRKKGRKLDELSGGEEKRVEVEERADEADEDELEDEASGVTGSGTNEALVGNGVGGKGGVTGRLKDMKERLRMVYDAVSHDEGGKVRLTRSDQQTVKNGVMYVQEGLMELMIKMMEMGDKLRGVEKERDGLLLLVGKNEKRLVAGVSVNGKKTRRDVVVGGSGAVAAVAAAAGSSSSGSSGSGEWAKVAASTRRRRAQQPVANNKGVLLASRNKTYAGAAAASSSSSSTASIKKAVADTIKGRVVVPGAEGWKTPPHKRVSEVVVGRKGELDARRLAEGLAKSVTVKDMGGTPQAVFKRRDGSVAILPRDAAHGARIEEAMRKV